MTMTSEQAVASGAQAARGFLDALTGRDFDALEALLAPDVWLRALLPRRVDEHRGADEVSAAFRAWYGAAATFEPITHDHDPVGSKERVAYRIRLRPDWEPETWHLIEQVAFLSVRDGRIRKIDLVCTGFMADS
jgi:ketosteroid isomerase-like protein